MNWFDGIWRKLTRFTWDMTFKNILLFNLFQLLAYYEHTHSEPCGWWFDPYSGPVVELSTIYESLTFYGRMNNEWLIWLKSKPAASQAPVTFHRNPGEGWGGGTIYMPAKRRSLKKHKTHTKECHFVFHWEFRVVVILEGISSAVNLKSESRLFKKEYSLYFYWVAIWIMINLTIDFTVLCSMRCEKKSSINQS